MTDSDFAFVADLLMKRAGIVLTPDKIYLLKSRLEPLARSEGLPSIDGLIGVVRSRQEERLIARVVDEMTTNETFFFRDKTPFEHLKEVILPGLAGMRRGGRIRIWCAACSTGQEPYSIAMMLDQAPMLAQGAAVEIVATDISDRVLEKARSGVYSQFEVQRGLPVQLLAKYFVQEGDQWRISERLRTSVTFRSHNLIAASATMGKFDVVFCRNVLIYFDIATKKAVLNRIAEQLNPGGYLLMGAAETVVGLSTTFEASRDRRGLFHLPQKLAKTA